MARAASKSLLQRRPSVGAAAGTSSAKRGNGRTGPVEGVAETLYQIRSVAKRLRPKELRESLEAVRTEAINVVSRWASVQLVLSWGLVLPLANHWVVHVLAN